MSERVQRAARHERRSTRKRRFIAGLVASAALMVGATQWESGDDNSRVERPQLTGYPMTDCMQESLKTPDLSIVKKKQQRRTESIMLSQQEKLCKSVGAFTLQLTDAYERGDPGIEAVATQVSGDVYQVVVEKSNDANTQTVSYAAEAVRQTSGAMFMKEVQRVELGHGHSTAEIENKNGIWETFSLPIADDNWPSSNMGFVYDVRTAKEQLEYSKVMVDTLFAVNDGDYQPVSPGIIPQDTVY